MKAKLEQNIGAMRLDSPDGNTQLCSHLLIRFSGRKEANDFKFAGGYSSTGALLLLMRAFGFEEPLQHYVGNFGSEETLALRNGPDGSRQTLGEIGFQEVATSSGIQRAANHLVRLVHGKHKNLGIGKRLTDLTRNLDAIQLGHADIDDRHIRFELNCLLHG